MVSWFQGFKVSSKSGSGSLSESIVSPRDTFLGFRVSRFHGFRVSRFQGFMVSSKSGSGSLSESESIISPRDTFFGFRVSWFHGFRVSGFRFHGFIQIGIGIAIGVGIAIGIGIAIAIGIDYFTTNTRDGIARVFLERQGEIPDFHEVSCVSRFHPNRNRDRYRFRNRLFNHGTLSLVSGFQGFRVSGFRVASSRPCLGDPHPLRLGFLPRV